MGARQAVLLTSSKSAHPKRLLFYEKLVSLTPLESALLQVFILKCSKPFRMRSYEKQGEGARLWLTSYSSEVTPVPQRANLRHRLIPSHESQVTSHESVAGRIGAAAIQGVPNA